MDPRLDAIALLFLSFAHATDGTLTGEEMRLVAAKLRGWQPDASLEAVGEHLRATVDRYKRLGDRDAKLAEARRCATSLGSSLQPDERARVIEELRELAVADGKVTPEELGLLDEVTQALGA